MAVKNSKQARRLAVMALALSAIALPGMASADPDNGGRGGWRGRSAEGVRQERPQNEENPGWRGRQQAAEAPAPAPAPQAAPQAQANWQSRAERVERPDRSDRGDRGDRGNRGGWNGGYGTPQAAPAPQAAPVPQPAQQRWNGGNRDRNWDRGDAARQQQAQQPAWRGRTDGSSQTWNRDSDRRQRDGNWDRNRNGGYVQGGTYYGGTNRDGRDWNHRDRDHDRDRDGRRWSRQWRENSHYNWYSYRSSHPSYFRLGSYRAPYRNYSYRRLSIGFYLENLFFSQNYWIDNPGYYRLPDVYGPYRWVRYYDDALLVDIYSGEVVDVIYDFFW